MITKNNTFGEVAGALANLDGIVSIQEIINTINQISNFKSKTIRGIDRSAADVYKPFDEKINYKNFLFLWFRNSQKMTISFH